MNDRQIAAHASDLWNHVFGIIDQEPDFTGDEAGAIAQAVQEAFTAAVNKVIDDSCGITADNDPLAKLSAVCDGWSESRPGGLVCTRHREGGIIDDTYPVPDKPKTWFVIFNDGRPIREGFATRDEAIDCFVESSRAAG